MADQLATPEDLASLMQSSNLDLSTAVTVIEAVTAVVQEAAGNQRLLQVVDDPFQIQGTTDSYLALPQRPVISVSSVVRDDGCAVTFGVGYKLIGNRMWSRTGWQGDFGWGRYGAFFAAYGQTPTIVSGIYTHGYPAGSQDLQLARAAVLGISKGITTNPSGGTSVSIDDYSVAYEAAATRMENSPAMQRALRRKYGTRAGLVRTG